MRLGSYDFYKPSIDVYGSLNAKKTIAFRVNTSYEKSRSFRDIVNAERFYVNPSLLFKLGKKLDILIEGDYLSDNRTADFGVGAINYALIDIPRNRFLGVEWSNIKTEQKSITSTITFHLNNNWQIRNVTSYQNFNNNLFANQRPNGNSQFIQQNGDWIRGLQKITINEDYYLTQLDLTGKFNTGFMKHTLLFGADADKYATDNTAYNAINRYDTVNVFDMNKYKARFDIPNMTPKTLTSSPINRVGVYVQDLISFTDKLKLLAGIRFSYLETFSNVYTYANSTNVETENYSNAYTPRIGLVYQPIKTMSIFASFANSFNPNTGVDVSGKALAPSYINQYEAGIKNDFCKGLISANITAYQIINSNVAQISLENGNTNTNIKELAGEITSQGLEVDIMTREWKGVSFIGGYSYNETKYTKTNTYIVGSKLLYNPNNTANASIHYTFRTIKFLNGLNLGVNGAYTGERAAGRLTRVQVPNDSYKPIPLKAFMQFDASIGYSRNNISIRLKLSNITNELNYYIHDDNSVNPIAPRQVSATIGFKF
jgi:iron complex outermembrane receptor protein